MKKAKLVFIAIALVAGIGGAFATRPDSNCEGAQQYYFNGGGYTQVPGEYGVGWYCEWNPSTTCSWYRPNPMIPTYAQCRVGFYKPVF